MIVAQFRDGHLHRLIESNPDGSWTVPADSTPTDTFTVFQTPYTFPAPNQDGTRSTQADIETIISDLPPWWAGAATLAILITASALTLVGLAYLADWLVNQL